jgi:hypothetical protein
MKKDSHKTGIDLRLAGLEADAAWLRDELALSWRAAQDEAVALYREWCQSPGPTAYARYRAAQDRADQAQDVLAAA